MKSKQQILFRIQQAANVIFHHGWAEANAGNLSLRLDMELASSFVGSEAVAKHPSASWFLVSRTGSRYRDLTLDPMPQLLVVAVDKQDFYFPSEARPTSEWITHKSLHLQDPEGIYPCLLHCHTTQVIAMCHTELVHDEQRLNSELARLLPELSIYLPEGVAFAPYAPPGSELLATTCLQHFGTRQALIWDRHGLLVRAADIDTALDLMEVVNKAATIYMTLSKRN